MSEETHAEKTGKVIGAVHGAILGAITLAIWHFHGRDVWVDTPGAVLTIIIVPFYTYGEAILGRVFVGWAGGLTRKLVIGAIVGLVLGVIREGSNAQLIVTILGAAFGFALGSSVGVMLTVVLSHLIDNPQARGR